MEILEKAQRCVEHSTLDLSGNQDFIPFVIVVDEDIDVTNLEQLIWAMCTRCDPATTIDIVRGAWTSPADPRLSPEQKANGDITNSRAIIDACKPFHWKDDFPPVNAPSTEGLREAREKFGYLMD